MKGNLLINFKSFHSEEKDSSSLTLLLLHFQVSPLQVLLLTYITLVTSVLPSAETAYQTLFPKYCFFKVILRSRNTVEYHYYNPSLDNDDMQWAGNISDVTIPHFNVVCRAQTCKGQHFLLEWAKVLHLYFTSVTCTTNYCKVQYMSLKWDLLSLPWVTW